MSDGEAASIKFEVFRGRYERGQRSAPIHKLQRRRWLDASNDLHGYANSTQVVPKTTCLLAELTEDLVDKHLLSFLEKLVSEPLDAESTASKVTR